MKATWDKFEEHMLNKGVTQRRIQKLQVMYNVSQRLLNKAPEQASREDLEVMVSKLHRNEVKSEKGKPFTGSTKADIKRFLKQFFKWYKGDNEVFPIEVRWINVRISKDEQPKEKPALSLEEARKLSNAFNKPEYRLIVLLLTDSGFRVGEMLSVKKRDLTWEDYDEGKKCFWIKCNASKTEIRKIPIPLFTEDIQAFVNSVGYQEKGDDELLFGIEYSNLVQRFKDASKKTLGKIVTPHALRHSSATYYAREYDGNMPMIAERYGWTFSSAQLKTYIRRSGAYQKAGAKKVYSNEVGKLKEENAQLKERLDKFEVELRKLFSLKAPDLLAKSKRELLEEEERELAK